MPVAMSLLVFLLCSLLFCSALPTLPSVRPARHHPNDASVSGKSLKASGSLRSATSTHAPPSARQAANMQPFSICPTDFGKNLTEAIELCAPCMPGATFLDSFPTGEADSGGSCPSECCVTSSLDAVTTLHVIMCLRGCCARLVAIQIFPTSTFNETRLAFENIINVNNGVEFLGTEGGQCKYRQGSTEKCGPTCGFLPFGERNCDGRQTMWVPEYGTPVEDLPCSLTLPDEPVEGEDGGTEGTESSEGDESSGSDEVEEEAGGNEGSDDEQDSSDSTSNSAGDDEESNEAACFPRDATVELKGGIVAEMKDLQVGDSVLVAPGLYDEVFAFTHREPHRRSRFVSIVTESGECVRASHGHYVFANSYLKKAADTHVGDVMTLASGARSRVVEVSEAEGEGLYNPQTMHGNIVVEGVVMSTYTQEVSPNVAHALLAPVRAASAWWDAGPMVLAISDLYCGWV